MIIQISGKQVKDYPILIAGILTIREAILTVILEIRSIMDKISLPNQISYMMED